MRCYKCESRIPPNGGYESPVARHPEGTMYCSDCIATPRVALVGCGASKVDTDAPVPAANLYDSNYFKLKREYARQTCDAWVIISAEHGVLSPDEEIEPYQASLDPSSEDYIGDYEAGKWSVRTSRSISTMFSFWNLNTTAVLLMGSNYLEHIEDPAFSSIRHTEYPFEDTTGMGDQMGMLRKEIDVYHPAGQSTVDHWVSP